MPKRTGDFDSWRLEKLSDPILAARYLSTILEEAPEHFVSGLGNVARANQITSVAEQAGTARETLYRSLSDDGNPTWKMLSSVMKVLQVKFKGVVETTLASGQSCHNSPAVTPVARRRRAGGARSKRSYSKNSAQLAFAFPIANANVVNAGKTSPLSQPSASAKLSSFSWTSPVQQPRAENVSEFNAMLATIRQPPNATIADVGGWV